MNSDVQINNDDFLIVFILNFKSYVQIHSKLVIEFIVSKSP